MARLQAEQTKLHRRIDTMYEDKLDGTINEEFFKRKSDECRSKQSRLSERIAAHLKAKQADTVDVGDLAKRAADRWKTGALTYEYKPPFEHKEITEAKAA